MGRLKKSKDGYYRTSITIDGIRKIIAGKTIAEVDKKRMELLKAYEEGHLVKESSMTLEKYADNWFHTFHANDNANTRDMYYYTIYKHIIPSIGHIPVSKIARSDIQAMIDRRKAHPATCTKIMTVSRQIFEDMVEDDLIHSNPCRKRKIKMPKQKKHDTPALTEKEKQAIKNANLGAMERAFVICLYAFGARRGEVLALMRSDFDFKNKTVKLQRSITFDKNNPIINENMKTFASERQLIIPDAYIQELSEYVKSCGIYLFTKKDGALITQSSYRKMWERIEKAINENLLTDAEKRMKQSPERKITALTFRHNFATELYYSGISRKKAVEMMGHASSQMIEKVYAALDEKKENTSEKINEIYKKESVI